MVKENQLLTTREFANRTGITASKVSKLIRAGKIEAQKISGKWMIHSSQLQLETLQRPARSRKPKTIKNAAKAYHEKAENKTSKPPPSLKETGSSAGREYTLSEFAEMTYLTENGVKLWLSQGLLTGRRNERGEWLIDAVCLQLPHVKRLVRKD